MAGRGVVLLVVVTVAVAVAVCGVARRLGLLSVLCAGVLVALMAVLVRV